MRNNKGITLIALVITIIVMLILVTVTIRVATDGNLFTHAANAVKDTKSAITDENAILDGNVGDKTIEDIVSEQTAEPVLIHFTLCGTEYIAEEGMTFEAWCADNRYNVDGYFCRGGIVVTPNGSGNTDANPSAVIQSDVTYGLLEGKA